MPERAAPAGTVQAQIHCSEGSGRASLPGHLVNRAPKEHLDVHKPSHLGNVGQHRPLVTPRQRCRLHLQVSRRIRRPLVSGPNWGGPDGRYRNTRSVSRRTVHSGRFLRIVHRPRSQWACRSCQGICAQRVAGGCRDHNGRRNMVDALRRHACLHHADTDVLRHRIDHPLAGGGDVRNRRRLLCH